MIFMDSQALLPMQLPEPVAAMVRAVNYGRCTDERLKAAVCAMRGAGVPVRLVCETLGVSAHLVQAAERDHPELLATLKERRAQRWELVETLATEGQIESLLAGQMKPGEMGLAGGIAATKQAEIRGEATMTIDVNLHLPAATGEDFRARVEALRARARGSIDISSSVSVDNSHENEEIK